MKKLLMVLLFFGLTANCVFAESFNETLRDVKQFFKRTPSVMQEQKGDKDEMTPSKEAVLYYSENNTKAAFEKLLSIKEADRTDQDWLLLGNILLEQDKSSDAIFMYKRAILINPNFYKPYYNLGNIYLEEEKPHMAIENYRKANKLNNKFPYAYFNLGCAYLKIGDLKRAKIAFLKSIELKNDVPEFHYNLAYTYKRLGKEKLAKQYLDFYNKLMADSAR